MSNNPAHEDEERAHLVAYLDGELDEAAARAVEAKLGRDPKARAEADALRQTWDLLDYLPKAEPSPAFTNRTLDRVSALKPSMSTRLFKRPWNRWAFRLSWAAAVLAAVGLGYAVVRWMPQRYMPGASQNEQQLVRDLRVIENLNLYQNVDDIQFLHDLEQPDLFGDDRSGW
jgi:anti-sigma factor RsiW